ncbi:MAG: YiiD C-terminal domain-containing protein [Gracilimonas sp.]|nr:YiiD C-terminal domain-containing protein [Gracilimonas sp.]
MTKTQIEQYLYKHIPITKALGVKAVSFSEREVKMKAPLFNNINHQSTAFGGSISSLLITTGWSYLRLLFDDHDPVPAIVIGRSSTDYLKPINQNFVAELLIPEEEDLFRFREMYDRFGKSRITLKAQIKTIEQIQASFEGDFVVMKHRRQ